VIGHRGAAAEAPENTLESLAAAVSAGADLVEFDVDEGLVVGHPGRSGAAGPLTLETALAYLAGTPIGIQLDLKIAGAEHEIAALVARHALGERVVVSSNSARVLRRLAHEAPELLRAIGYPRDRAGVAGAPWPRPVVRVAVAAVGPLLRARVPLLLASARAGALCLHHGLVTPTVVATVHSRGAALVAWTVNEPARVGELARLGVDAITSDDPRMVLGVLATLPGQ
jgi:glycerophosphoryl diester phosphodiesterase